MSKQKSLRYETFIVQFWEEPSQESPEPIWRFTMEDPRTGHRRGYTDFETLVEALRTQLETGEAKHDRGHRTKSTRL